MNKLLILLTFLLVPFTVNGTINVAFSVFANPISGLILDSDGDPLPSGAALRVGTFDESAFNALTPAQQLTFAEVDSLFFTATTTFALAGGSFTNTGVPGSFPDDPSFTGAQIYVWAFNNSDPASATEWGIFSGPTTNANWQLPFASDELKSLASSAYSSIVVGGTSGSDPTNYTLAAIPEPGTVAAVFGLLALSFAMVIRRRRQISK